MELINLFRYFASVVIDGTNPNIWLYTLPESLMGAAYEIGLYIAALLGGA